MSEALTAFLLLLFQVVSAPFYVLAFLIGGVIWLALILFLYEGATTSLHKRIK